MDPVAALCAVHLPRTADAGPVNGARGVRGALSIHPVHLPRTADAVPVDGVTSDRQRTTLRPEATDSANTAQDCCCWLLSSTRRATSTRGTWRAIAVRRM